MNQFILAFVTGLTTGGVSCFAVQGSLLLTSIASDEEAKIAKTLRTKSLILFLLSKIVAYTILGLGLGFLGQKLVVAPKIQGIFQILIGIYMLITAANLANLHPIFKKFVITPPKFIFKILKNQSKVKSFFTPIFLGALTVLIPCGVTQGMMLLALSSGNPIISALILFFFILGTSPIFFVIGLAASKLFEKRAFSIIAAVIVAILGINSINSGQVLRGSVHTIQNYWQVAFKSPTTDAGGLAPVVNGVQEATINVAPRGYTSDTKKLKVNVPVKLTLVTNSVASCARAFTIPKYGISKILPATGQETIEFTPTSAGKLTYTCSMGMYSGYFDIIE